MMEICKELKAKYDDAYSDKSEEWRKLGAKAKVDNILHLAKELKISRLIDIGAGDGNLLDLLSQNNFCPDMTAVEISASAIKQIKKKSIKGLKQIMKFDGYNLPFSDNEFDLAICSHVIEHVEFPRKLLREIKRISKQQIFEVPIDFSLNVDKKFQHFNSYGHINIYTPSLFRFLLLSEGFELIKSKNMLYKREVSRYKLKIFSKERILTMIKRLVWKLLPFLMKIKPNAFTVLTK